MYAVSFWQVIAPVEPHLPTQIVVAGEYVGLVGGDQFGQSGFPRLWMDSQCQAPIVLDENLPGEDMFLEELAQPFDCSGVAMVASQQRPLDGERQSGAWLLEVVHKDATGVVPLNRGINGEAVVKSLEQRTHYLIFGGFQFLEHVASVAEASRSTNGFGWG